MLPFEKIKREILIKKNGISSEKYGKYPEDRTVPELIESGIIVVDKPSGPTSHQVSDYLKRILNIPKAGHSGTLDPAVTGVLPIALNKGTRIVQSLLSAGKEYVCVMHLHDDIPKEKIEEVMSSFVGKIKQLPPVKSAIKRQWRYRKIYYIKILEVINREVLFIVGCQAGTYIRKLCHDIGSRIGCGAHMAELRRTKSGPFNEDDSWRLQDIADAYHYYKEGGESHIKKMLLPIERGIDHLPKLWVLDSAVDPLCHGVSLKAPGISKVESEIQVGEDVAVMTLKGELIMVGKTLMTSKEILNTEKGVIIKPSQVFMKPGTYPRNE